MRGEGSTCLPGPAGPASRNSVRALKSGVVFSPGDIGGGPSPTSHSTNFERNGLYRSSKCCMFVSRSTASAAVGLSPMACTVMMVQVEPIIRRSVDDVIGPLLR